MISANAPLAQRPQHLMPIPLWSRPAIIVAALITQIMAAVFFVGDSLHELSAAPDSLHPLTELPIALSLCLGTYFTVRELRRLLRRSDDQARALALASSAFLKVIDARFSACNLTAAEREVAWMSLKGLEVSDIARLRGAANGTVRAQLARIYGKSGVTGRAQFASLFVEHLMSELPARRDTPPHHHGTESKLHE